MEARCEGEFVLIADKDDLTLDRLISIEPRYVFFPHWSYKIPAKIHERFECIIFHMTDLPYGRGGSPLQNLIVRGHQDTVMTALRCVEELDAGPVYLKRPLSLHGSAEEIFIRASRVIEGMMAEIIEQEPEPQRQEGKPTVFRRRKPEDGNLKDAESLEEIFDWIRMLDAEGYPRAFLTVGGFTFEFSRAAQRVDGIVADVRIVETSDPESMGVDRDS